MLDRFLKFSMKTFSELLRKSLTLMHSCQEESVMNKNQNDSNNLSFYSAIEFRKIQISVPLIEYF